MSDTDCPPVEVCDDSHCTHAWNVPWLVTGATSDPLGCDVSFDPNLAFLDFAYDNGPGGPPVVHVSTYPAVSGCPFEWSGFVIELPPFADTQDRYAAYIGARIGTDPDGPGKLVGKWCWDTLHSGKCGPIPAEFLVAGQLDAPELHVDFARAPAE